MNAIEVLEAVIKKGVVGGWEQQLLEDEWHVHMGSLENQYLLCYPRPSTGDVLHIDVLAVVFDKDFARCLFGEQLIVSHAANNLGQIGSWHQPAWQHHIQALSIADHRINYLKEHALCLKS